jgi:hypothetical protein
MLYTPVISFLSFQHWHEHDNAVSSRKLTKHHVHIFFGAAGTTVPYFVEAFGRLSEGIESDIIYPSFSPFTALPQIILHTIFSSMCLDVSSVSISSRMTSRMAWLQLLSPYAPAIVIHTC